MPGPERPDDLGEYRDYLMALALAQVPVDLRGRVDPSDLVQETLCEALRDREQHRGGTRAELMGWLRSVLRFNLIDRLRRLRHEAPAGALDGSLDRTSQGMGWLFAASQTAPDARAVREEDALRLAAVMKELSAPQAEAIILKHCQGMSVDEICRHMNRTPDAV